MELYKKNRPGKLKQLVGQDHVVEVLERKLKKKNVPHTVLLTGPSGCGKTTVARILKCRLKCGRSDFNEMNASKDRGIEAVRTIDKRMRQAPINGKCRIWFVDEAHKLSNDAQNAFLKILEDTPKHVYFILATPYPQKLIKEIHTRSMEFKLKGLSDANIGKILKSVAKKEKFDLPKKVRTKIVENCEGSARKSLVMLDQIIDLEDEKDMIKAISEAMHEAATYDLCKLLMNPKASWKSVAKILLPLQQQKTEPETIRYSVMGYAQSALLKGWGNPGRAYMIIDAFRDHFYDSKFPGVVAACYEIVSIK